MSPSIISNGNDTDRAITIRMQWNISNHQASIATKLRAAQTRTDLNPTGQNNGSCTSVFKFIVFTFTQNAYTHDSLGPPSFGTA